MVDLWLARIRFDLDAELEGYLLGIAAGRYAYIPTKLSQGWDQTKIIEQIQKEFGLDYSFLLEDPVDSIGNRRNAYRTLYVIYHEYEKMVWDKMQQVVVAHQGLAKIEMQRSARADSEENIERTRMRALKVRIAALINQEACYSSTAKCRQPCFKSELRILLPPEC